MSTQIKQGVTNEAKVKEKNNNQLPIKFGHNSQALNIFKVEVDCYMYSLRPCITNFFLLRPYWNDYGNWRLRQNDYRD